MGERSRFTIHQGCQIRETASHPPPSYYTAAHCPRRSAAADALSNPSQVPRTTPVKNQQEILAALSKQERAQGPAANPFADFQPGDEGGGRQGSVDDIEGGVQGNGTGGGAGGTPSSAVGSFESTRSGGQGGGSAGEATRTSGVGRGGAQASVAAAPMPQGKQPVDTSRWGLTRMQILPKVMGKQGGAPQGGARGQGGQGQREEGRKRKCCGIRRATTQEPHRLRILGLVTTEDAKLKANRRSGLQGTI